MTSLQEYAANAIADGLATKTPADAERPGVEIRDDKATIVSDILTKDPLNDVEATLRERGINPDEWIQERCIVNTWESTSIFKGTPITVMNHQLKIFLKAKIALQLPSAARIDGPIYTPSGSRIHDAPFLIAFLTDQQGAYYDRTLHGLTCEWLAYNRPAIIILGGDGLDLPGLSRFEGNPAHDVGVNECIQSYHNMARDYILAAEPKEVYALEGNHEARMQKALLAKLPNLFDVKRANEEVPTLTIPYLCRFDELGITYIGNYPHGSLVIPPAKLTFRHGWIVRPGSARSALSTLDMLGHSVAIGHVHTQSVVHRSFWDHEDNLTVLTAMESGTMAKSQGGLGYTVAPNWQQGFGVVQVWPDGDFVCSNAQYANGVLKWQDQRFV